MGRRPTRPTFDPRGPVLRWHIPALSGPFFVFTPNVQHPFTSVTWGVLDLTWGVNYHSVLGGTCSPVGRWKFEETDMVENDWDKSERIYVTASAHLCGEGDEGKDMSVLAVDSGPFVTWYIGRLSIIVKRKALLDLEASLREVRQALEDQGDRLASSCPECGK